VRDKLGGTGFAGWPVSYLLVGFLYT